jgi:tRNA nucleotidyltransferase (CCA-adding enzyme)
MQVFLIGGAVRDMLMDMTPKDKDFVVVGSTQEEMEASGFEKVGADLHFAK